MPQAIKEAFANGVYPSDMAYNVPSYWRQRCFTFSPCVLDINFVPIRSLLTLSMLGKIVSIEIFFFFFSRQQAFTFHANCLQWNNLHEICFLGKNKKNIDLLSAEW